MRTRAGAPDGKGCWPSGSSGITRSPTVLPSPVGLALDGQEGGQGRKGARVDETAASRRSLAGEPEPDGRPCPWRPRGEGRKKGGPGWRSPPRGGKFGVVTLRPPAGQAQPGRRPAVVISE